MSATEQNSIEKLKLIWGEDNIPEGLSLASDESVIPELGFRRLCSFRANLVHKLTVIARAHGGKWENAAQALGVRSCILRSWRAWDSAPGSRNMLSKIDSLYETSLEKLKVKSRGRFVPPTQQ
jgi:hypothetical protein